MVLLRRALVFLVIFSVAFSYKLSKQNTLYEWNPGDTPKANGQGEYITVGYIHDFTYVERRGLIAFDEYKQNQNLNITFTFKDPVGENTTISISQMLEDWGQGKSKASDPTKGAPAEIGDATWRYPFYNGSRSLMWHERIFGGYFDEISSKKINLSNGETSFSVLISSSEYGYLIKFENKTKTTLLIHGMGSEFEPTATIVKNGEFNIKDFYWYIIPGVIIFVIVVITTVVVFIRCRRRSEYIPLLDLEEGDIHLTQLKDVELKLIQSKVKRVDESSIRYGKRIGSGTTGEVYSAQVGNVYVAVKKIKTANLTQELQIEDVVKSISSELIILSKLYHKNILGMIGVVIGEDYSDFGIITKLMERGNLTRTLYNNTETVDMKIKRKIIVGVAKGMWYLHQRNPVIIHRDLKPENILLDNEYNPKITDFGISRFIEGTLQNMTISGTPSYMAPESLLGGTGAFSKKSDVYSYGVITVEIINQERPTTGMSNEAVMMQRARGIYEYKLPADCDKDLKRIVSMAVRKVPADRPSFTDILIELNEY